MIDGSAVAFILSSDSAAILRIRKQGLRYSRPAGAAHLVVPACVRSRNAVDHGVSRAKRIAQLRGCSIGAGKPLDCRAEGIEHVDWIVLRSKASALGAHIGSTDEEVLRQLPLNGQVPLGRIGALVSVPGTVEWCLT